MVMRFDSIKSRLLLMTLVCIMGMGTLVISQHMVNQQLLSLSKQKDTLLRLSKDLLQLRRHEKDFLLRRQMRYVRQFSEGIDDFNKALADIAPFYNEYRLDQTKATELAQTIQRYDDLFKQVVSIHRDMGLTQDEGLRGEFNRQLGSLQGSTSNLSTLLHLSEAKTALQDLLLNYDTSAVEVFNLALSSIDISSFNQSNAKAEIASLTAVFEALTESINQMGETESEGLRGEFRTQAHLVESRLASIDDKLQPIIEQQGERVRLYNLLIAIGTCVLMVTILVKSFATFHRAFSYFVMFFYQCKREFQRIDPKKLGFAEFKSLAELANEMVEARKDAELQLEAAKKQLKEQKKGNDDHAI